MNSVHAELIEDEGEPRYKIIDVIVREEGLGVENLWESGMIEGESSIAYNDIITINLVTCRAIGIGANLVRLGQRTIQVDKSHIILTGAGTLNKMTRIPGRKVSLTTNLSMKSYNPGPKQWSLVEQDMHDQVLKFGSYIVDALTEYNQPIMMK
ncbi:acetyl-CoA carboxylase 1-like isoform X2 [Crassostrea virginica]